MEHGPLGPVEEEPGGEVLLGLAVLAPHVEDQGKAEGLRQSRLEVQGLELGGPGLRGPVVVQPRLPDGPHPLASGVVAEGLLHLGGEEVGARGVEAHCGVDVSLGQA